MNPKIRKIPVHRRSSQEKTESSLPTLDVTLDKFGVANTTLTGLPKVSTAKEILTEMEFIDPNGEIQTVPQRFRYGLQTISSE